MATQSHLIAIEAKLIVTRAAVQDVLETFHVECRANDGQPYPENRDVWGTLRLNAVALRASIELFLLATQNEFS